jgi:hypothetical protein
MLTPHEAVLNVGAADILGRDKIRMLNAMGQQQMYREGSEDVGGLSPAEIARFIAATEQVRRAREVNPYGYQQEAQPFNPGQNYIMTTPEDLDARYRAQQAANERARALAMNEPLSPLMAERGYQYGTSDVISDPDDPRLNINRPGQPGYVPSLKQPISNPLVDIRARFANELKDPNIRTQLFNLTHREVGGQGPQAQQAFIETLFNRAITRNKTLSETINDKNYYPASSYKPVTLYPDQQSHYGSLLDRVAQGSNVSNYATGNASGSTGFGGGPKTASYSGENFGIEKPDLDAMHLMGLQPGQYPTVPLDSRYTAPASAAATGYLPGGQPYVPGGATSVPTLWTNYAGVGFVPKAIAVQQPSTLGDTAATALGSIGKGLTQASQAQQQGAQAAMSRAIANVPTSNPLLEQLANDPLAPLRAAGLV